MNEATITIRFSRAAPPSWPDRLRALRDGDLLTWWKDWSLCICRLTHSEFSHVDLKFMYQGREALLGASNNPYAPYIAGNPSGVAIRPINYENFAVRRDAVIATEPHIAEAFEKFCLRQLGKPFDSSALSPKTFLSPQFERDWRQDNRWFCAELMGRAAEMSDLMGYEYPGVKNRLTAADLLLYLAPKLNYLQFRRPISYLAMGGAWEH